MMKFFKKDNAVKRIETMLENAINGNSIDNNFDESEMSRLESKFADYLSMTQITKSQLEEEKKNINEFISDISHQTKTPISNIILYSDILKESNISKENLEYVEHISAQAKKLDFLISFLIKASRLETGIISVNPKLSDLDFTIEKVIASENIKSKEKNITITFNPSFVTAYFDPKWTEEAIYNIVDNAIKYTPNGGQVNISVTKYEIFTKIDIKDTGIGIKDDEFPKIFQRFFRSNSTLYEDGIGIGLYLSRQIITLQGGYIKVSSTLGKGATFSVFLPNNFK